MQAVLVPCRLILRTRSLRELLLCLVLLGLAYSFVLPFFSLFGTRELGMSAWLLSSFLICSSLSSIVAATALSRWSDVWLSRRTVLIISCLGGTVGYAGYAFVRDVTALFLLGCLVHSISAATFPQLFAYAREQLAREQLPADQTPLYMNVFRLTYALAWTVGPALAAWTMHRFGFRGTFLGAAAFYALLLVGVLHAVRPLPPLARTVKAAKRPLWHSLKQPGLLPYFSGFVLLFCASTMGMLNLPLLILETLHGTAAQVGIAYSLAPAFELPLMFYFGLLASKGHQTRLIKAAAFIAVVYYLGLCLVRAPWQIFPLQILSAALVSITSGVAITFFQDYLPDQPGSATNLFSSASRLGSMVGYVLFGVLADGVGHRGLFVVCTALSAITAALFVLRGRPQVRQAPAEPVRMAA